MATKTPRSPRMDMDQKMMICDIAEMVGTMMNGMITTACTVHIVYVYTFSSRTPSCDTINAGTLVSKGS